MAKKSTSSQKSATRSKKAKSGTTRSGAKTSRPTTKRGTKAAKSAGKSKSNGQMQKYLDEALGVLDKLGIKPRDDVPQELITLLDEVKHGGDTQLPNDIGGVPLGGTFSPLAKGRRIGLEVTYNY